VLTHVEFRSDLFPPLQGEDKMVNPGIWGRRLANFLRQGLIGRGYEIGQPRAEDWGWRLLVTKRTFSIWIGCANYGDGGFLCFIEPHKQHIWRFLRRIDTRVEVQLLHEALDDVLAEEEGIRDRHWWTHQEFNVSFRR